MKILKTLAVLFVLLVLTVGAVAEENFVPYSKDELEAMTITLPVGMDEAVTDTKYSDGLVQIYVDSDKVKWDYVAAQSNEWDGAEIFVYMPFLSGTEGYQSMIAPTNVGSQNVGTALNDVLGEMWLYIKPDALVSAGDKVGFRCEITSYSAETGTVTPIKYNGNRSLTILTAHYANDVLMNNGLKYALIEIVYTDGSSMKVGDMGVPSDRIEMDAAAEGTDSHKSSGTVAYKLAEGNSVDTLTTYVTVPEGAESVTSQGKSLTIHDSKVAILMTDIGTEDYYASKTVNLLWYKADGTVLDAERAVISVEVGDPVVWPNYIEKQNFTKADVNAYFIKGGSKTNTAYMTADYNAPNGTVQVKSTNSIASAIEDMTEYGLRVELTPPEGAAYGTSYGVVSTNMMGKKPNNMTLDKVWEMFEDLMKEVEAETNPDEEAYVKIENGKAYFDDVLFKETSYKNDPGLKVYYDANLTSESAATLQMIDWRKADGSFISRQWFAVQFEPLAGTDEVAIEAVASAVADTPTLVAETAVEDYTLRVQSYPQVSETGTQIHYELELLDANGLNVSLSELNTDVQLLLPYQTEGGKNDDTVVYTVNHYNANGGLKESATEADGSVTLTRVDGGLLMTIKSLSPFVLSYVEAECKHDNLTYVPSVSGSDKNTEGVITETCSDCDHKATWTIAVDKTCVTGKELVYKVTHSADWKGGDPAITYIDANAMEIFNTTPTKLGKYELSVRFTSGATLHLPFEVVAAPAMPATGDNSLPLAALLAIAALALTGSFMLRRKANG